MRLPELDIGVTGLGRGEVGNIIGGVKTGFVIIGVVGLDEVGFDLTTDGIEVVGLGSSEAELDIGGSGEVDNSDVFDTIDDKVVTTVA